jgi:hypothetical protein
MTGGLVRDPSNLRAFDQAVAGIVFIAVSWPCIVLRMYVRAFLTKWVAMDDVFAVLAQVCFSIFPLAN